MQILTKRTRGRGSLAIWSIAAALSPVSVATAQSLPETVIRLDSEVKSLRLAVTKLEQLMANRAGDTPQAAAEISAVFQKGSIEQSVLAYDTEHERLSTSRNSQYLYLMSALASLCTFKAVGIRVEGKAWEFSNVVRVNFPAGNAGFLAAEFEGLLQCDTKGLYELSLPWKIEPPPPAGNNKAPASLTIPCSGGVVVKRNEQLNDTIQLIIPFIPSNISDIDRSALVNGRWGCTARVFSDAQIRQRVDMPK